MLPPGGHLGIAGWRCGLLSAGVDPQVEAEDPAVVKARLEYHAYFAIT